ncbi:MAG: hypothetical protein EPO42_13235 [Gallionellaceae bacterium]|nr:MAG: hypothetical protein EPO42_13235 [Gallionellaceae bacterium]
MLSDDDYNLLHGSAEHIAGLLGVSPRTAARYKSGASELPEPCRRLLRLRRDGDISAIMGKDWEGFYFGADGLLYLPTHRNGFDAHQIRAMFFTVQECAALRADLRELRSKIWAMQKVRDAERSGGKVARLREHAAALQRLSDLIALEVGDDGDAADDAEREILNLGHFT